uniref:Uncharacterized protein n=1 Tax=Siphoviridae sp. ctbvd11 TaxID=2825567 RepID=A0A8S5QDZ6_9CAUD|nr:MAG TPA: hypothetical protein [Siphoviridae sp. ctbvd11]
MSSRLILLFSIILCQKTCVIRFFIVFLQRK